MKTSCVIVVLLCGDCASAFADKSRIETVAGTGSPENNGDSGASAKVNVGYPFGVEVGPDGALYVTEAQNHRVMRIDLATRRVTTVAGRGRPGYSGDGGPAVNAELNEPYEVRFDAAGNMYFVEMQNHVVRRVDAMTKRISTVAGNGRQGFGGDGGPADKALFNHPHSIALDKHGGLYVADIGNHRIRRVDLRTGSVESVAGSEQSRLPEDGQVARGRPILGPRALFVDGETLWIALREGHSIWRMNLREGVLHHVAGTGNAGYSGDGGPAIKAAFNGPKGIAVTPSGDVFVADTENDAIRRIDAQTGEIFTVAGPLTNHGGEVERRGSARNARLNRPHGVCVGPDGAVFIGDTLSNRVRRLRLQDVKNSGER